MSEQAESDNRFERHPVLAWTLILFALCLGGEVLLRTLEPEAVQFAKDFREVYRYHPRWYTDFESDTSTTIRLTDGGRGYYLNFLVTVNEFGFRWHDRLLDAPLPEPAQVEFLHAIGDSFTMGWGVNYESSYPALLGDKLGENYAVMNLGLNRYGTIGATEKSIELMGRFPPRAAVYLFTENDYEDDVAATRHAARPGIFHLSLDVLNGLRRHSYLASSPWGLRWWLYFRPGRLAGDDPQAEFERAASIHSGDLPASSDPGIGQPSKRALLHYVRVLSKVNVPLFVIAHGEGPAAADFTRFCIENGIESSLVTFDERLLLRREGHLNRVGNRLLAEYVQSLLLQSRIAPR